MPLAPADARRAWLAERDPRLASLLARLRLPADASLLALGPRALPLLLRHGRPVVIEDDPGSLDAARAQAPSARFFPSLDALTGEPAFDAAVALDALQLLDDPIAPLDRIARWLLPSAPLLVTVPAHPSLLGPHDRSLGHRRRYTPELLRRHLAQGGFALDWLSPVQTLALGPAALRRIAEALGLPSPALPSRPAGALLDAAARAEGWWLRRGRLPLGLSLAAIARRR